MKKIFIFLVFLFLIGMSFNVQAQLTGSKTIPGNYATIADAITDLDTQGVGAGGVTFNVAAGYTETSSNLVIAITVNQPTAASQVVFQKSGAGANPLITAAPGVQDTTDAVIKFSGADYITFDAIDVLDPVSNTGTARMEKGYVLLRASPTDGSQHNVIRNCNITLQKTNTFSIGLQIVNRDTSNRVVVATDLSGQNSSNRFYGNTISDVYRGISVIASSLTRDVDNEIGVNGLGANSITNWGGSTVSSDGIRCEGQINVKINNNIVNGGTGTSNGVNGIIATLFGAGALVPNYEISYNHVIINPNPSSSPIYGIRALATADTVWLHHNVVENSTASPSGNTFGGILHQPSGVSGAAYIYDNIVRNMTHTTAAGTLLLLGCEGTTNYSHIYGNRVYGNQKTGASGTIICLSAGAGTTDCESNLVYDNSIPNSSGTATSAVYGYRNSDPDPATENVFNNTIYNLSIGGSGTLATNIVAGMRSTSDALSTKNYYGNSISGLSTVVGNVTGNTTGGGAVGIWNSTGTIAEIHRNKIFDLTNTNSNGTTVGVWVSAGSNNQIYNNVISDLKAPNSGTANAVIGLNFSSTVANTTIGAYDNSIFLTASGGATFGSSGVSVTVSATATTASLEMINNNIINLSTSGSTSGFTVAYRRSAVNLQNYALTSDSNNFYAGTPAANRLIFFDGINSDQNLATYKARVAPRDANSTTIASKTLNLTINFEACAETDTIIVELRKSVSPFNILESVTSLGGEGIPHVVNFEQPVDGVNYYIVVRHRNSIETWSKTGGEVFSSGILTYDFTTAASQAYGNNMVNVAGEWSLFTGDVNQDGIVDGADLALIDNDAFNFVTGYVPTDLNCDSIIDGTDAAFADNNAFNFVQISRP